jgi:RNA polymerase sigma-70 factor (ECF subfamily)
MAPQPNDTWPSDQFLEAIRRGDARAREMLVHDFRAYLVAVAKNALGGQTSHSCDSVVQEGFRKAFQRIDQFRGLTTAELKGWLARIVANEALDRKRGKNHSPLPTGIEGEEMLPANGSTPSAQAMRRERAALVLRAKEKLPPDYSEAIDFRFFQNLGYDEIASRMGRNNNAVRQLVKRALQRLRDEMGAEP